MDRRMIGLAAAAAYILAVYLANLAVARLGVVAVGFGLAAPSGVYLAGVSLGLRDVVQDALGRVVVVGCIVVGAGLSYLLGADAVIPGGHASIAVASGVAFLASELLDMGVYTPMRERSWLGAVAASNTAGAVADSVVFLWLAYGGFAFLRGQVVGKLWVTAATLVVLYLIRGGYRRRVAA